MEISSLEEKEKETKIMEKNSNGDNHLLVPAHHGS